MDSANNQASPASILIPSFVENLNAVAERHGIAVRMTAAPYDDAPEIRLWAKWSGTKEQLRRIGILLPSQRFPQKSGRLMVPPYLHSAEPLADGDITISGEEFLWEINTGPAAFTVSQIGDVNVTTYADETVYHGSAEALGRIGLNTSIIPRGKHPAKVRSGYDLDDRLRRIYQIASSCRRQPDGLYVLRIESVASFERRREAAEEAARERQQEVEKSRPSDEELGRQMIAAGRKLLEKAGKSSGAVRSAAHLRLVVDNDRVECP